MSESPRILLIDDDDSFYRFMADLVGAGRVHLEWKACGRDGLRAFDEAPFDLILLDYQLPDMLGTEVLEKLREAGCDIPIVMLTGYATVDVAVEAMKRGAADFFTKPLADPAAFIRFLNRTLSLEEPLSLPGVLAGKAEPPLPPQSEHQASPRDASAAGALGVEDIRVLCAGLDPPVALSRRECEIASALLAGRSNKEMAAFLHISERTVKNHLTHIYAKFGVDGRSQLFHRILTRPS